jgi:chorismate dehydratase
MVTPTRLGSISYVNSLPVDLGILKGAVHPGPGPELQIISDVPQGLNARVLRGELDVTPVSALHYAENADRLVLLPDLSVSSESGVQSVLLFSKRPIAELKEAMIRVTDQGKTTPALLRILLETRYGCRPIYTTGASTSDLGAVREDAVLLIGDDALRAADSSAAKGWLVADLSQEWLSWTGRPFVFAVWSARREFWENHPDEVLRVLALLLASRCWAVEHEQELIVEAQSRSGFAPERLRRYYRELRFDLDVNLMKGMMQYFDAAARLGILKKSPRIEWLPSKNTKQQGATTHG